MILLEIRSQKYTTFFPFRYFKSQFHMIKFSVQIYTLNKMKKYNRLYDTRAHILSNFSI